MEINNLLDKGFKGIRVLIKLGKRIHERGKNFNKEVKKKFV